MLRGFALHPDGTTAQFASIDELAEAAKHEGARFWVDVEHPDLAEMQRIGAVFGLDADPIEDSVLGEQRPRVDDFDGYLFLVVYGAVGPEAVTGFAPRKLALFFSPRFLVTVHEEALRTTNVQLKRLEKRPDAILKQGLDYLVYSILDSVVDNYALVVESYAKRLDDLEDRSLQTEGEPELLADLMNLRRELLEIRRVVSSQRELVSPIAAGEMDYISEELEPRFSHVRDHLTTTLELIDSHREILQTIRENHNIWLSNRLNEVMKVLTIFASFFLPLSLIAGIYGMNTSLWPDTDRPGTFWVIMGLMGITVGVMLAYFRRKKWF